MVKGIGGKKFNKIMVFCVYFGNWLCDYLQVVDVGIVKFVFVEVICFLFCIFGFLSFGYGLGEFEVIGVFFVLFIRLRVFVNMVIS